MSVLNKGFTQYSVDAKLTCASSLRGQENQTGNGVSRDLSPVGQRNEVERSHTPITVRTKAPGGPLTLSPKPTLGGQEAHTSHSIFTHEIIMQLSAVLQV